MGSSYGVVWLNERIVDGHDVDIVVLHAVGTKSELGTGNTTRLGLITYALRKTILPMRPKPLMPTWTIC